ncbi:hypothetical protein CsSME_00041359 [Camellia sinensis var. sinensis]
MATGGSIALSSSLSSSYLSRKISISTLRMYLQTVGKLVTSRQRIVCSAVQELSTPTVAAETKEMEAAKAAEVAAPEKPKPPAKAPALPELMEEEVIPLPKETLGSQDDISELELSFEDNKLEGSFLKGYPYSFWAFFPDGVLTGPKGFSLSSYGYEASTVEPFLIDEKKITAKHVVFWVEKRLAAQGIIPVWKE